jgi:LysM repeat protein
MEKRTSAFARILAALALVGAVITVVVVISAADTGDSSSDGRQRSSQSTERKERPRSKAKTYVVKPGDTLTSIAHQTGVPVSELQGLNPEVDPQILIAGETLKLR